MAAAEANPLAASLAERLTALRDGAAVPATLLDGRRVLELGSVAVVAVIAVVVAVVRRRRQAGGAR